MDEKDIKQILAENTDLKKQVAALSDANFTKQVEDLEAKVTTIELEKSTLKDAVAALKSENEELVGTNKGLQVIVDEMQETEKARLIAALAKTPKYKDEKNLEELKGESLSDIKIRHNTLEGANMISVQDEAIHATGFPKASEEEMLRMAGVGGKDKFRDALVKMGMQGEVPE